MKKKNFFISIALLTLFVLIFTWISFKNNHTYTLHLDGSAYSDEMIIPVFGKVTVRSTLDTSIELMDLDTKEVFTIGYVGPGLAEQINLKRNHRYVVKGNGDATFLIVNISIS